MCPTPLSKCSWTTHRLPLGPALSLSLSLSLIFNHKTIRVSITTTIYLQMLTVTEIFVFLIGWMSGYFSIDSPLSPHTVNSKKKKNIYIYIYIYIKTKLEKVSWGIEKLACKDNANQRWESLSFRISQLSSSLLCSYQQVLPPKSKSYSPTIHHPLTLYTYKMRN